MSERIQFEVGGDGVAHVRLNRPERLNAIDGAMFDALLDTCDQLAVYPGLRAVVLSGEGRAFCTGIDLGNFERIAREGGGVDLGQRGGGPQASLVDRTHGLANGPQQAVLAWRDLPVPVVAVLHGVVFGGGLQLALGADLRFATPDARLSVLEVAWGLVPDMAGMLLLGELARADVVRELVFSAREFSGREALQLGLVTRVGADPLAEALAWARSVAQHSPHAVRAAKRLLNAAPQADAAQLLLAEASEQQALLGSANQREAVAARMQKRPARFVEP